MLAIDIETMGLHKHKKECPITMICIYDQINHIQESFPFLLCIDPNTGLVTDAELYEKLKQKLLVRLQNAQQIASYNGVLFDLPFIASQFHIPDHILSSWILKTIDIFYSVKMTLNKYFKLKDILSANQLEEKSADGLQAIEWARMGEIQLLQEYCMQDTVLTWKLCNLEQVIIPSQIQNKSLVWSKNRFMLL